MQIHRIVLFPLIIKKLFHLRTLLFLMCFIHTMSHARHSIAPAFGFTYIQTTQDDQYQFYLPALNYTGDFRVWDYRLYFSISTLFPVASSQNGKRCDLSDYYSTTWGADFFIGLSKDYTIVNHFRIIPAVGWHYHGIRLRGKSKYKDFYSFTSGFGFNLLTKYRGKHPLLNFVFLSFGMDFMDLLYTENKLKRGGTVILGIGHSF